MTDPNERGTLSGIGLARIERFKYLGSMLSIVKYVWKLIDVVAQFGYSGVPRLVFFAIDVSTGISSPKFLTMSYTLSLSVIEWVFVDYKIMSGAFR